MDEQTSLSLGSLSWLKIIMHPSTWIEDYLHMVSELLRNDDCCILSRVFRWCGIINSPQWYSSSLRHNAYLQPWTCVLLQYPTTFILIYKNETIHFVYEHILVFLSTQSLNSNFHFVWWTGQLGKCSYE